MNEELLQAYARLTSHEFMLEVLYAQLLAQMPEAAAEDMKRNINRQSRMAYTAPDANPAIANNYGMQIAQDATVLTERFLEKVSRREREIREQLAQAAHQ